MLTVEHPCVHTTTSPGKRFQINVHCCTYNAFASATKSLAACCVFFDVVLLLIAVAIALTTSAWALESWSNLPKISCIGVVVQTTRFASQRFVFAVTRASAEASIHDPPVVEDTVAVNTFPKYPGLKSVGCPLSSGLGCTKLRPPNGISTVPFSSLRYPKWASISPFVNTSTHSATGVTANEEIVVITGVGVTVGVLVGPSVGVAEAVKVGVAVGVLVAVLVAVLVGVYVGVLVPVGVHVGV